MKVSKATLELLSSNNVLFSTTDNRRIKEGDQLDFFQNSELEPYIEVVIGNVLPLFMGSFSYSFSKLWRELKLGRYCSIAGGVSVMGDAHPLDWVSSSPFPYTAEKHFAFQAALMDRNLRFLDHYEPFDRKFPIVNIDHDVWIGENALLARGISIGPGAVVAARAVVTKDVEPYAVVAGVPARVLRKRHSDVIVERLLASKWWQYHIADLIKIGMKHPVRFLDILEEKLAEGTISGFNPPVLTGASLLQTVMK